MEGLNDQAIRVRLQKKWEMMEYLQGKHPFYPIGWEDEWWQAITWIYSDDY